MSETDPHITNCLISQSTKHAWNAHQSSIRIASETIFICKQQATFNAKYEGIEWRVMQCDPMDGFVDAQTIIHCDGSAINDIKKIYIRPKYDSLPAIEKNCNMQHIKE
eukprot:276714_1